MNQDNRERVRQVHREWHSRGFLPHFDVADVVQGITFRLNDALPRQVVEAMVSEQELDNDVDKRARYEEYLNAGYGSCCLADERIGRLVEDALLYFDGERYRLLAWVIMPNHVHVLVEIIGGFPMDQMVHSWKSYTASEANKILGRSGRFWYPDYFDRYIRDENHLGNAIRYIHFNPVAAELVDRAEDWVFGSARLMND